MYMNYWTLLYVHVNIDLCIAQALLTKVKVGGVFTFIVYLSVAFSPLINASVFFCKKKNVCVF